jgi:hypothetical protein
MPVLHRRVKAGNPNVVICAHAKRDHSQRRSVSLIPGIEARSGLSCLTAGRRAGDRSMNHSTPISTTLTLTMVTTACSLTSTALLLSVPASSFFERSRGRSCGCQSIGTDVVLRHDFWRIWFILRPSMEFIASWWRPIQGGRGAQNLYLAAGFLVS